MEQAQDRVQQWAEVLAVTEFGFYYQLVLRLRGRRQGSEADHSPPSSAEVKHGRIIPQLHHMPSWHSA
jgi:hypothetical protein